MRTRVGVFFGGVSVEHEVSVISALQAIKSIDENQYEVVPVYISKDRNWYTGEELLDIEAYKDLKQLLQHAQKVSMTASENGNVILQKDPVPKFGKRAVAEIDVAFPIVHGTFGEDGALQGLFELYGIPYVGCDVMSSAAGMDKVVMKQILRDSSLPVLEYVWFYSSHWAEDSEDMKAMVEEKLGYPVIVKPANLGSSVGINKAENTDELDDAVEEAMSFASKILIERMVTDMKEVNCSVVGDYEEVEASVIEEVLKSEEILSYQDKYQGGGKDGDAAKGMESTDRVIPAPLDDNMTKEVQELAKDTFQLLGCSGVSRIDFLIDEMTNQVYVNEINTIPGSLSFYLWDPAGKDYQTLTSQLIQLALKRKRERDRLTFSIDSNLFSLQSAEGVKGGSKNNHPSSS
ncbi:D-alanine-D-alanine ligase [Alteribacillus persepolensis]|uniref:D-alanine--D-alanine ligase n=1 Tax=Alteribacillus persepolensis TaxID=568899 RepID=A0A1G8JIB0_9BACI|nr:D-alanine--D-alanine ligase family protein [Alteribacillus persepolensis]SDI30783.1 D-alanine-D-alanine ligase [Alteribacillus persepolensis]